MDSVYCAWGKTSNSMLSSISFWQRTALGAFRETRTGFVVNSFCESVTGKSFKDNSVTCHQKRMRSVCRGCWSTDDLQVNYDLLSKTLVVLVWNLPNTFNCLHRNNRIRNNQNVAVYSITNTYTEKHNPPPSQGAVV